MISTDLYVTGAAAAAPMPAVAVRYRDVSNAPTAAPFQGSGLPCAGTSVARPWAPSLPGGRFAGDAERTTSSTPGAQPPSGPLS